MRKLILSAALASFAFVAVAHAGDTTTTAHSKVEKKVKSAGATDTTTTEANTKALDNGGTEKTVETEAKHDESGMKNDRTVKTKHTVKRDAAGNVVSDEKTAK